MRLRSCCSFGLCGIALLLTAADDRSHASWTDYLGGPDSSQYSALKQINKSNLNQLQVAWSYPTGDKNNYTFNPVIVDGMMYVLAKNNSIVALDAATAS
jgi:quinoprotein glucose dehydrogenase